jgi:hypothetical protein
MPSSSAVMSNSLSFKVTARFKGRLYFTLRPAGQETAYFPETNPFPDKGDEKGAEYEFPVPGPEYMNFTSCLMMFSTCKCMRLGRDVEIEAPPKPTPVAELTAATQSNPMNPMLGRQEKWNNYFAFPDELDLSDLAPRDAQGGIYRLLGVLVHSWAITAGR